MDKKPVIAITMGDPAGIGPEIIAKAFEARAFENICKPVVVGNAGIIRKIASELRLSVAVRSLTTLRAAQYKSGTIDVLSIKNIDPRGHVWGRPDIASGKAVVEYVRKAVDLALKGQVAAVATAPINKDMMNAAGFSYSGHTELLAHLTGTKEYGMMFTGAGLRLILTTIHHALRDVPALITKERVLSTIRLAHKAAAFFGIDRPRIGVAALNPHSGEGGLFGTEEQDDILPAVLEARAEGIHASDPLPADTLFYKARNGFFDIVVAMYHDQGLAPLKMLAFGNAVNITVGLPIIRTSVDHGTAYDIAGKGCADPASLIEAVKTAVQMSAHVRSKKEGT